MNTKKIHNKWSSDFFGFWVKNRRISLMLIFLILGMGYVGVVSIPKELSPQIKLGLVSVNTIYPGASPQDVDDLVTSDIEDALEDIDEIKKIESTSSTSFSSVIVTLKDRVNISAVVADIDAKVNAVSLPDGVSDPVVTNMAIDSDRLFSLLLYVKEDSDISVNDLRDKAIVASKKIQQISEVSSVDLGFDNTFDVRIVVDEEAAKKKGITPQIIAQVLRGYVSGFPLGSYRIADKMYDYRFEKAIASVDDLMGVEIPIATGPVLLSSFATLEKSYDDNTQYHYGLNQKNGYRYVSLNVKKPSTYINVYSASDAAKAIVDSVMSDKEMKGISYVFADDAADAITKSNKSVINSGLQTILLVFLCVWFFVSFRESLIATFSIPLAFLVTFFVLQKLGYTMNFMTNFSLIVTFGIAIDTIIVILEGAKEKLDMGYNPRSAALLTVKEYKTSLIAGTATTCAVFLPLFVLPGVMGKFLANIPVTIFITLVAALFISLLINPAVYYLLTKKKKTYYVSEDDKFLSEDEITVLTHERKGKKVIHDSVGGRHSFFLWLGGKYQSLMRRVLHLSVWKRRLIFLTPLFALVGSFFLGVGFVLFPANEANLINVTVSAPSGSDILVFEKITPQLDALLVGYPEIEQYRMQIKDNVISLSLNLIDKDDRRKNGLRDSFVFEEILRKDLAFLEEDSLDVDIVSQSGGPSQTKGVGISLSADNLSYFASLEKVAADFQKYFESRKDLIDVVSSNISSPGQYVFSFDQEKLKKRGLSPGEILANVNGILRGASAGNMLVDTSDREIKVLYDTYQKNLSPKQMEDIVVQTSRGPVRIGDVASYTLASGVESIKRSHGDIVIKIEADTVSGTNPNQVTPLISEFAESYDFPEGVSYTIAGENAENADLFLAIGSGFALAIFLIFSILLLQFNSVRIPFFILYAIVMGLLGTMVGLKITGNTLSMPAMIGFFALAGVVVNDAIVLIERINSNIRRGMSRVDAISESGSARMIPIVLTTVTTILGLISVAQQDKFFAGLGYTIIFGLFVGSLATLFVVPVIYDLFVSDKKLEEIRNR